MASDVTAGAERPGSISRPWNIVLWVLQVAAAAMFLGAGFSKLTGAAPMVALFDAIGWGQWFRYTTGIIEVIGAILLLIPALCGLGALILMCVMIGATAAEILAMERAPAVPLGLLVVLAIITYARRDRTRRLWRGSTI